MSASTGDRIEALYRNEGARLWRSVYAFTADREVTNDAVAEAFAQLLRRGDEVGDARAWVWRVAFRIAAGEMKRRRTDMAVASERPSEPADDDGLIEALGRLSSKQRASVILHYYAGYSTREVAGIIGSTGPAVRVHLSQGRKRLRAMLEEDDG